MVFNTFRLVLRARSVTTYGLLLLKFHGILSLFLEIRVIGRSYSCKEPAVQEKLKKLQKNTKNLFLIKIIHLNISKVIFRIEIAMKKLISFFS